jgi:putative ABC transport system ATP-binding protein
MTPMVELTDIHRRFGTAEVLRGIAIQTMPGQVIALYGRSGSGKTTLLNIVGGLDRPDQGRVLVDGTDLSGLAEHDLSELRRMKMGFVFQSYGLLSHLRAIDNVEFAQRLAGVPRREWRERAEAALDMVGLTGRLQHFPAELSGGERQRVAIARALAVRPRLLLADEPTGALDHATGLQVTSLLVAFARESGASVWIATHDTAVAQRVDRAYSLRDGNLVPREEVRQ